ncbi:MAG: GvpL/GvpF family gas vesicle protein [Acidobacteria bacterium]|nr:GvpL/GvpF family gas vesicle protein [Acidobacteriota bacterium]MBV9147626.1 GvpL/GvpF family gas vesicle protein [Acidobacteriota bacterium]MBV9436361.1 GvpL/GvpF family gas vesicle protein [Acidobacteriota bacterium]
MLYLYGISAKAPKLKLTTSISGSSPVERLEQSGFVAWYSRVSDEEFGEKLASNMENLEWLSAASVRHQRVVSQIADAVSILPARFGTVFHTEQSLSQHIVEERDKLSTTLQKIDGAEEWGIKLFLNPDPPASPIDVSSGRDYLRAKAAVVQVKKQKQLDPDVVEFARELQAIAAASAPAGKVSSGQPNLEWQASFLVRKKDRPKWDKMLKRYATRWADRREIQCTGPWPPYSFV